MKSRSHLLAAIAIVLLSWNANAQGRFTTRARDVVPAKTAPPAHQFGSYERTKLLRKGRGGTDDAVIQLGAVDRRTLLTTGKSVYPPKPKHHFARSRR